MPIDATRFGVGHRRPQGPAGSRGVEGRVIHSDARGAITELAFARDARLMPHESRDSAWLCVIEGGGWVQVGNDRRPVASGEAISWPAGIIHAAWTDHAPMRAMLIELAGPDDAVLRGILEGLARLVGPGEPPVARGEGWLAERAGPPGATDALEGEPR